MPYLLDCCRFTEADRADYFANETTGGNTVNIKSKKNSGENINEEGGNSNGNEGGDGGDNAEEEEGEYEIGENEVFTTLRKSSAFTLERFSSKLLFYI